MNNQELYGSFPRVSETICERTLGLAGQSTCHNEENTFKSAASGTLKVLLESPNMVTQIKVDQELRILIPPRLTLDWTIPKKQQI